MKKTIIPSLLYLFVTLLVLVISSIYGSERMQSWAFFMSGPAVGFVIGVLISKRNRVINLKKFRTDLTILLSLALIGSFLIVILLNEDNLRDIYVISLNVALLAILILRNAKNFATNNK